MRTVTGNQIIETRIEEKIDHFQPQSTIDTILDIIVGITIFTCIVLSILYLTQGLWEKIIRKKYKDEN